MQPLYPLALDLRNRPVLVVGGGPVAARKLPELLACGAALTVVAPQPGPAVERLAAAVRLLRRPFKPGDIKGQYLVFACTSDPALNRRIAGLCRKGSILCNVADAAETGSFHVPGVIRKGGVTVTVGTGGAAPGLTRLLKRQLSEALGEGVAELAEVLGRFRAALRAGPDKEKARDVLEHLPYRQLLEEMRSAGPAAVEARLQSLAARPGAAPAGSRAKPDSGKRILPDSVKPAWPVSLVGAGPGHPQLMTLLAVEALRKADVIIHDRLIPEETLNLASPDCLLIPAGKRGHFESARQEQIEKWMVDHALAGKRVVRLKGGDPFVYGRGWEEVAALEAHGLPWVAIPGLSSVTAAPTWAGIPLTHRGVARSFAVMSGMAYSQTNTEVPKADTIVLVMGLQRLAEIVPAFLAQGWKAETPVAAIMNATLPDQRVCISTLAHIEAETVRQGFDSPTLLVIGEVVGLLRSR